MCGKTSKTGGEDDGEGQNWHTNVNHDSSDVVFTAAKCVPGGAPTEVALLPSHELSGAHIVTARGAKKASRETRIGAGGDIDRQAPVESGR